MGGRGETEKRAQIRIRSRPAPRLVWGLWLTSLLSTPRVLILPGILVLGLIKPLEATYVFASCLEMAQVGGPLHKRARQALVGKVWL